MDQQPRREDRADAQQEAARDKHRRNAVWLREGDPFVLPRPTTTTTMKEKATTTTKAVVLMPVPPLMADVVPNLGLPPSQRRCNALCHLSANAT